MLPWRILDRGNAPDGTEFVLYQRGDEFSIRIGNQELMSNRIFSSEKAMAEAGCAPVRNQKGARVLIGGLGVGYTLRAVLDFMPQDAKVIVAELVPAVVKWNQGVLKDVAGDPLADSRSEVYAGDVADLLKDRNQKFDAILLDVDNGPIALSAQKNQWLYGPAGLQATYDSLHPKGTAVIWSAGPDDKFAGRMKRAGFAVDIKTVAAHSTGRGTRHTLFIGRRK